MSGSASRPWCVLVAAYLLVAPGDGVPGAAVLVCQVVRIVAFPGLHRVPSPSVFRLGTQE
jgi:hypothetical protein